MVATTLVWMSVPVRIVYRESSQIRTELYSVEEKQHGQSFFLTPAQKKLLERIRWATPVTWFSCAGVIFVAILAGAAARLRMPSKPDTSAS
jgi:hypothetical protein